MTSSLPPLSDYWTIWFLPIKTNSPGHSRSNSSPAWVMSLGPSALVPVLSSCRLVIKPCVSAARTVSRELLGVFASSRGSSESLPKSGIFQSDVGLVKIFSLSVGYHFVLTVSFAFQKLFSFRRSHLLIVSLSVSAA